MMHRHAWANIWMGFPGPSRCSWECPPASSFVMFCDIAFHSGIASWLQVAYATSTRIYLWPWANFRSGPTRSILTPQWEQQRLARCHDIEDTAVKTSAPSPSPKTSGTYPVVSLTLCGDPGGLLVGGGEPGGLQFSPLCGTMRRPW